MTVPSVPPQQLGTSEKFLLWVFLILLWVPIVVVDLSGLAYLWLAWETFGLKLYGPVTGEMVSVHLLAACYSVGGILGTLYLIGFKRRHLPSRRRERRHGEDLDPTTEAGKARLARQAAEVATHGG